MPHEWPSSPEGVSSLPPGVTVIGDYGTSSKNMRSQSNAAGYAEARKSVNHLSRVDSAIMSIQTKSAPKLPSEITTWSQELLAEPNTTSEFASPSTARLTPMQINLQALFESATIYQVLNDELPPPLDYSSFFTFAKATFCSENVEFWKAIKAYTSDDFSSYEDYEKETSRLAETYIGSQAEDELNLPRNILLSVREKIGTAKSNRQMDTSVFEEAVVHISRLMDTDTFARYKKKLLESKEGRLETSGGTSSLPSDHASPAEGRSRSGTQALKDIFDKILGPKTPK